MEYTKWDFNMEIIAKMEKTKKSLEQNLVIFEKLQQETDKMQCGMIHFPEESSRGKLSREIKDDLIDSMKKQLEVLNDIGKISNKIKKWFAEDEPTER